MTHPNMPSLFHTGIIVDDLDLAMREMGEELGLHWAEPSSRQARFAYLTAARPTARVT